MFLFLWIFTSIFKDNLAQFPPHTDYRKVSDFVYGNQKYKILKPTLHIMRDHFKDVMTKTVHEFPSKKVLMDNNGFRHYWSGFEEAIANLKKIEKIAKKNNDAKETDRVGLASKIVNIEALKDRKSEVKNNNKTTAGHELGKNQYLKLHLKNDLSAEYYNDLSKDGAKKDINQIERRDVTIIDGTKNDNGTDHKEISTTMKPNKPRYTPKRKPKQKLKTDLYLHGPTRISNLKLRTNATERTLARTTFFCPFIGIITTEAYID